MSSKVHEMIFLRLLQEYAADEHDHYDDHDDHSDHNDHFYHQDEEEDLFHVEEEFDSGTMMMTADDGSDDGKPWKEVFFASLLINMATLSGVIVVAFSVLIPRVRRLVGSSPPPSSSSVAVDPTQRQPQQQPFQLFSGMLARLVIPAFAAGALLATSVFLIIPESIELIGGGHEDHHSNESESTTTAVGNDTGHDGHNHRFLEDSHDDHNHTTTMTNGGEEHYDYHTDDVHHSDHTDHDHEGHAAVAWKFGCALLAGYLLPFLMGSIFAPPHMPDESCPTCEEQEVKLIRSEAATTALHEAEEHDNKDDPSTKNSKHHSCEKHGKHCASSKDEQFTKTASDMTSNDESRREWKVVNIIDVDEFAKTMSMTKNDNTWNTASFATAPNIVPTDVEPSCEEGHCHDNTGENAEAEPTAAETATNTKKKDYNYQLIGAILLGDACHNFTDGIFVGNAFLFCEHHVAYAIVLATLFHELAQEVADFCLLTHHCGLNVTTALVLNFISGLSVMLGAFVILSVTFSTEAMGITLAVSAGVYMYTAGSECIPRIMEHPENKTLKNRMIFVLCFALGAVPIGLVLINHSHGCE